MNCAHQRSWHELPSPEQATGFCRLGAYCVADERTREQCPEALRPARSNKAELGAMGLRREEQQP